MTLKGKEGSPREEEPGKSGVGIAHVRLHPPPPPLISIFSLRRPPSLSLRGAGKMN